MAKPSWFEPTNNISEVSEPSADTFPLDPSMDFQKIRCLWLISFVQDLWALRDFLPYSTFKDFPPTPHSIKSSLIFGMNSKDPIQPPVFLLEPLHPTMTGSPACSPSA